MDYEVLKRAIGEIAGASFVGMDTLTDVKLLKGGRAATNPHYGRVKKLMTGANVMVFTNENSNGYENMVKRRLAAEGKDPGTFTVSPLTWGTRIEGTPFLEHKGEKYIQVIFHRDVAPKIEYLLDGQVTDKDTIQGWPAERENTGQAGLENHVPVRAFKVSSIVAVRHNGREWR